MLVALLHPLDRRPGDQVPAAASADAGICGYDWVYENGSDVQEVCELNYSKATSNPVRWVLAVPNDSKIKSVKDLAGKRISSEAVGLVKRYLKKNGVKADVEFSCVEEVW